MKTKEFNLSDEIEEAVMLNKDGSSTDMIMDVVVREKIEEFIRLLKERISIVMNNTDYTEDDILKAIDYYAGDKLIK